MGKARNRRRNRKANRDRDRNRQESVCLRWLELPDDLTASILSRLGAIEIIENAQKVCTNWREICKDPSMWKSIDMRNLGDLHAMPYDLVEMCRHAVDRSCGGLIDINIEYFGTDQLLHYIALRTSQLKRLRLIQCWYISDEGLSEAAEKFSSLEELEIYSCNAGEDAIAAVGRCCPLLKSFKFNQMAAYRDPFFMDDDQALKIAENMHGLRHLQLIGNSLTNRGLQAILDGCPNLESLDLRKCFFVDLEGDLGKRCSEQIKNLKLPNDSVCDFGFRVDVRDNEDDHLWSDYTNYDYYYSSDFSYDDFGPDSIYAQGYDSDYDFWLKAWN